VYVRVVPASITTSFTEVPLRLILKVIDWLVLFRIEILPLTSVVEELLILVGSSSSASFFWSCGGGGGEFGWSGGSGFCSSGGGGGGGGDGRGCVGRALSTGICIIGEGGFGFIWFAGFGLWAVTVSIFCPMQLLWFKKTNIRIAKMNLCFIVNIIFILIRFIIIH